MAGLTFGLMGVAGFVAPRHLRAIKDTGNTLAAALDPNDSVGILDSYFPEARFFIEFERFDRHVDKLRRQGLGIDYVSICSPNYLHDAHVRFALRSGADAICEKPLVLNPWNLDGINEMQAATGRRVSTILQLRLHPSVIALKDEVARDPARHRNLKLTYITSRGPWYHTSWKGDVEKSGGVATNIGVHFFDMLIHLFGPVSESVIHHRDDRRMAGYLKCGSADISWFLSIDAGDLPPEASGRPTWRSITMDGAEIEFSEGFKDLHTRSYEEILSGKGFDVETVRPSIELVSRLRAAPERPSFGLVHPAVNNVKAAAS